MAHAYGFDEEPIEPCTVEEVDTLEGIAIFSISCVDTQLPSARCVMNCPSLSPRMISKTKKGLPSDFVAIWWLSRSVNCGSRQ